jgi:hypothetical protein
VALPLLGALLPACAGDNANAGSGGEPAEPQDDAAAPELAAFDAQRAWAHLEAQVAFGPRPSGSDALEGARAYIEKELRSFGLEPVREAFTAETPLGEIEMANVYAELPGEARGDAPPPIVILASHYDTKRMDTHPDPVERGGIFLGANDGASSTAVLLELARVLSESPPRPVTYRFLFLDGEEATRWHWDDPDNCYGSRHHTQALRRTSDFRRTKACVLLDMVGDKDLHLVEDPNSTPDLREIFFGAARRGGLGEYVDGRRQLVLDDHTIFRKAGIPAVDLIDLDYVSEDATGIAQDWWHTEGDTVDKCSPESLDAAGRIVLLGLPELEAWVLKR